MDDVARWAEEAPIRSSAGGGYLIWTFRHSGGNHTIMRTIDATLGLFIGGIGFIRKSHD